MTQYMYRTNMYRTNTEGKHHSMVKFYLKISTTIESM